MIPIPTNKKWTHSQDSDILGSLWSSFNLDLTSNIGATRVNPRMVIGTDDIANLGIPIGFARFNAGGGENGFFTVAGDRVFATTSVDASAAFAVSSGTNTAHSSDTADIMFYQNGNKLVSSMQTTVQYNNAATWNAIAGNPLTSGSVHMMTEYKTRGYVTEEFKKIYSFNTAMTLTTSGTNTFEINTYSSANVGLFISDILGASDKIWIFTINAALSPARVYTWDGTTANVALNGEGYVLDSGGVLSAILIGDIPYIINCNMVLQSFNGGTFVDVPNGKLPTNPNKYLKNVFSSLNNRPIHPNGMILTPNNRIRIFINNIYEDGTIEENMPSGIWEFDLNNKELGWYHISSPSLYTSTVTDYGQNRVSRVGGLYYGKTTAGTGINLIGAQIYSDATTTKEIIATDNSTDTIQKGGYFVTSKIFSSNVEDAWTSVYVRNKPLLDASDSISVKYRTTEIAPTEATVTWSSTTSFSTTTNVSAYAVGDEVEILQGIGGGRCSHITAIQQGSTEWIVTVEDTFTGATGTAIARFQKWIKAGVQTSQTLSSRKNPINKTGSWIQFKVCMIFKGEDEINDLLLAHEAKTPVI